MSNFRNRSKTVGSSPNRLKPPHAAPKSRTPLTFRKFADFLLRRKKRKAEQDPNSLVLEKQIWFHGKITAEYAERCMRREGDFLVREDPAKPGSCFLVVRCKNKTTVHLPISKVKSSKGNRIKYKIEEGTESFDSISELINLHVHRRSPLTPKTGAVIVHAVSRDTTLLADEVFTPGPSNKPFFRHNTDVNAFATLRHTPVMGRTRERKNSDPLLSTRVLGALNIDQGQVNSRESGNKTQSPVASPSPTEKTPVDRQDSQDVTVNPEDLYDTPENNSLVESLYDKPGGQHMAEGYYDKPEEHKAEETYDKPENNSLLEELYDKPCNRPERVPSLRHSDPSAPSQKFRSGPRSQNRSSVPLIDSMTVDLQALGRRGDEHSQEKPAGGQRHPDGEFEPATQNVDALYSVPPLSNAVDEKDKSAGEPSENVKAPENLDNTGEKAPDTPPKDRNKIYLEVMRKIQALMVEPFIRCDSLNLARHMTRMELEILWQHDLDREAWSLEDGSGGAEGLEMLTLPQGRSRRSRLIDRYTNVSYWVAALLVGAGDLGRRELVLAKLIDLADILSDKLGNLVSFMAIMDGLTLPQVSRLHHTWSCLHHQHSSTAILYHSTLVPLAGLLQSGAPSPFPGVCLPYIVPLARFLEMSTEEVLNDWAREGVDLGLGAMLAHLDSGRTLTQQLHVFRQEAVSRLQGDAQYHVNSRLESDFKSNFNVGIALGLAASPSELAGKVSTLLHWLSENAENSIGSPTDIK